MTSRVHLADLGYPAPRLLSKLDDKVRRMSCSHTTVPSLT